MNNLLGFGVFDCFFFFFLIYKDSAFTAEKAAKYAGVFGVLFIHASEISSVATWM